MILINYFSSTKTTSVNNHIKQNLDPISVLATIALLPFKELKSRLAFWSDYTISIQEPSNTLIPPSVSRMLGGQGSKDLDMIKIAIKKTRNFVTEENRQFYNELFDHVISGLKQLKRTYKSEGKTLVAEALNHAKTRLTQAKDWELKGTSKSIWSTQDIIKINALAKEMNLKKTAHQETKHEVEQYELIVSQKQNEHSCSDSSLR